MPTKRLIKVRSQFEDGFLKSFELISVTPEFDRYANYRGHCLKADYGYSVFVDNILWIDTTRQQNTKYAVNHRVSRATYMKYFKEWNKDSNINVIDINKNILGEL